MKKSTILFLLLAMLMVAGTSHAQSSLIATLNHEGTISVFYGADALQKAHGAATHGDVITLSAGTFSSCDITKAVTIRGAGIDLKNPTTGLTKIEDSNIHVMIPDEISETLTLEGLYISKFLYYQGTLKSPVFSKCRFAIIGNNGNDENVMVGAIFLHCKMEGKFILNDNSTASLVNCYVCQPEGSDFNFTNCVIGSLNWGINTYNHIKVSKSVFLNSIIIIGGTVNGDISESVSHVSYKNSVYHCISNNSGGIISNITNRVGTISYIFESWDGNIDSSNLDNTSFELTEDAAAAYLGEDGTQVGMYGGAYPYDPTPSNPRITKCNVASESTADGKLSVEIEVNGDK